MTAAINRIDAIFSHNAATIPDQVHLLWTGQEQTYGETYQRSSRLASLFSSTGIGPGDRVLTLAPNSRELVELYIACSLVNAICVPVNTLSTAREVLNTAKDCEPAALIVHSSLVSRISDELGNLKVKLRLVIGDEIAGWLNYDAALTKQPLIDLPRVSDGNSPAVMIYSSGTTGKPKGILLRQSALVANAQMTLAVARYQRSDRNLAMLPLFSSFGFCWDFMMTALAGSSLVLMPKFDAAQALKLVAHHRVTIMVGVPTMFAKLFEPAMLAGADVSSVRLMDVGGGPVANRLKHDLKHVYGIEVIESYGLTEISPVACAQYPGQEHRAGSTGPTLPGVEVKVIDAEGRPVASGVPGELCFRSETLMVGYWNQPALTAKTIVDDWLHSGDIGVVDADGHVYIQDRVKDMIVTNGNNVYPKEVENALCDHAAVQSAAVVGVPDSIRGEVIHAFVVLKNGSAVNEEQLIAHCATLIGRHKLPKAISFVTDLPLTASGKIQRFQLREAAVKLQSRPA